MTIVSAVVVPLFEVVLVLAIRDGFGAARLVARVDADEPEPDKSGPSSRAPRFLFEPAVVLLPPVGPSSSDISITLAGGAETPACGAERDVGKGCDDDDDAECRVIR